MEEQLIPASHVRRHVQWTGSAALINPEPWMQSASCAEADPDAFFPEKGGSTRDAKSICASCDVRSECLAYALANDERYGIWGGLAERDRRKLQKMRSQATVAPLSPSDMSTPLTLETAAQLAEKVREQVVA